ncbi:MAG: amino acid adenylation domain-containing protein, partial [Halanaerobiales bacterium]|nr:amino acid adenylation domain-containing protein [Halanaerobiales bacterium]
GRIDNQVKIRGFRIELGEIENQLLSHEEIKEAVVIDRIDDSGNKYLCAYIVSDSELSIAELKAYLGRELPNYMVPADFVQLEKIPLTPNGKIDRRALPKPDGNIGGAEYVAPTNVTEEKMVQIWSDILGVEKVGINDDFFELGGHSLKATQLVSRVLKEFNVELPLKELFNKPILKNLVEELDRIEATIFTEIEAVEEREYYPVSSAEKRLFALRQLEGESTTYNMPNITTIEGVLDRERLEEAFKVLVQRHESLRTSFVVVGEEVVRKVHPDLDLRISFMEAKEEELDRVVNEFIRPFDLGKAPLFRVGLIKYDNDKHLLMLDMHHIISDGASMNIFFKEFVQLYQGEDLPELKIQYKDYACWQHKLLKSEEIKKQEIYWLERFAGEIPVLNLPTDAPRSSVMSFEGDMMDFSIDKELADAFNEIASSKGATLYMALLGALNVLLSKYTGQDEIIIGSPVAGRRHADLENIIGIFVNTLVMRNELEVDKSFAQFLETVKENALDAFEHQDYQFEMLVEKLQLQRDLSRNPLFDIMFVLQNTTTADVQMPGLKMHLYPFEYKLAQFDLIFNVFETSTGIHFNLDYSTKLFKRKTIERMTEHLVNIIHQVVKNPEIQISEIEIISADEKQQLLVDFNNTMVELSNDLTIHQLFEEQALKTPDHIVGVFGEQQLTYGELNEKANQFARVLREKGVGSDIIVAMLVERSLEMMIGILGILKSGGAYLSIDPEYPEERIEYMLEDSQVKIVLTQNHLIDKLQVSNREVLSLDDEKLYRGEMSNLEKINSSHDLAYVIYTSGSTGKPKAVMIEHCNIVNTIVWRKNDVQLSSNDKVLQLLSYSFDAFVVNFFTPVVCGAQLIMLSNEDFKDPMAIKEVIRKHGITHFNCVPSLFSALLDCLTPKDAKTLRMIALGGEQITANLIERSKKMNSDLEIVNEYGPTENSVVTTCLRNVQPNFIIPIGQPIMNTRIYIVDSRMKLVPMGVPGEICIAGAGLARGYLNRPELTAEKFVQNHFVTLTTGECIGERMYRTGDLGRWRSDGMIEFIGRVDYQVKIRGYRIEIGEIEAQLLKHKAVKEVAVIDRDDMGGTRYLCAYFVSDSELMDLREYLLNVLPEYMIPAFFIQLEKLPLTLNGKLNRKALPEPDGMIGIEYVVPKTEEEEKLAEIWGMTLGREQVGINDNFFELGGDSIKAIQIIARVSQQGINITVKDIFKYKTIDKILKNVDYKKQTLIIPQGEVIGEVLLTPIQTWFFELDFKHKHYFHQSNIFKLREDVDLKLLEKVFKKIIAHHDALRMGYKFVDNKIIQFNRGIDEVDFRLEIINLAQYPEKVQREKVREISVKIQDSFDLEKDLLVKAVVFDLGDNGKRLFIPIHHLIIDAVSWRILIDDLKSLYQSNLTRELPLKTTSFKDWSHNLNSYAQTELIDIEYWQKIDQSKVKSIAKTEVKDNYFKDHNSLVVKLDEAQTEKLQTKVNWAYNTEINDILLTALTMAITEAMDTDHFLLNLEGHGREEILENVDISRTIGWFTSTYPVYFEKQETIEESIKHVKESLRRVPNKGVNFDIALYLTRDEQLSELNPEISFNYLGQFDNIKNKTDQKNESLLSGCIEDAGFSIHSENEHVSLIDISGITVSGELQISLRYNVKYLDAQLMEHLKSLYYNRLVDIIEHCVEQTEKTYTASDFGVQNLLNEQNFDYIAQMVDLNKVKMYALTPMQEGMLFHYTLNEVSRSYYEQMSFYLEGEVDIEKLITAWRKTVNRHEILRTRFFWKNLKNPIQLIFDEAEAEVYQYDQSDLALSEQEAYLMKFKEEDLQKQFDMEKGQLNRLSLVKLSDEKYLVNWIFHHILLDGWSVPIIMGDFFNIYYCLVNDQLLPSKPAGQFGEYLEWLKKQKRAKSEKYWENYMKNITEPTFLPYSSAKKDVAISEGMVKKLILDQQTTRMINEFCKKNEITINTFIQTAWGLLMQKYNNTNASCFGMTVSGRPAELANVESIVGIFLNTLPVIIRNEKPDTIKELLTRVNNELIESREHEYISLAKIQKMTNISGKLFDSLLIFENFPVDSAVQGKDLGFSIRFDSVHELTNFDLTMTVASGEMMIIKMTYNADLLNDEKIEMIQVHLSKLIDTILADENKLVNEINIITVKEKEKILKEFNRTAVDYPDYISLQQLFEEQMEKTPNQIALIFGEEKLTYREFNKKANQLAHLLRAKGVGPDHIVGIMVDRSLEMLIGIMAILKAGGAYLPLDPEYPEARIEYILTDSNTTLLLTQKDLMSKVSFVEEVINLEDSKLYKGDSNNPEIIINSNNLAYIIYTSGSTGMPKGVMLEHRSVLNTLHVLHEMYPITASDAYLLKTTYTFDVSVAEIFGWILGSGKLVILKKDAEKDPKTIVKTIAEQNVTHINFVPSMLNVLLNTLEEEEIHILSHLKYLFVAGEAISKDLVRKFYDSVPNVIFENIYGPTESTIYATKYSLSNLKGHEDISVNVPIGKPLSNIQAYIVDQNLHLQPIGVPGELCLAGSGLARGYLNRLELTTEKFVQNHFRVNQLVTETKMYKTGDLARWLPDGNIEYLGRIDHQVKIRGYRIELGEIENQLLNHPEIKEAAVVDRFDVNDVRYICAYIISDRDISVDELRVYLAQVLPDYMIPSHFVELEKLPLLANGKLDKKSLPEPSGVVKTGAEYVAPRNEIEEKLVEIWEEILEVKQVGVYDNFFALGGHSIASLKVVAKTVAQGWTLTVQDIFSYPTIEELAKRVSGQLEMFVETDLDFEGGVPNLHELPVVVSEERIDLYNVLITGVTGFLGIHILEEILLSTDANVYCLVRAEDQESAKKRLLKQLEYYFGDSYHKWVDERIIIIKGDVGSKQFGLSDEEYINLGEQIDSIVHSAAITKHFGYYSEFEKVNVFGTKEITDFALTYKVKLHHISTVSVSGVSAKGEQEIIFTENDFYVGQMYADNVYVRSKFVAENLIFKAIEEGLEATIYRVGHLTGRYRDGYFQKNIGVNGFYNLIRSLLELGVVASDLVEQSFEFTAIDYCSRAIVAIAKTKQSTGKIFHVYNAKLGKMSDILKIAETLDLKPEIVDNQSAGEYINSILQDKNKYEMLLKIIPFVQPTPKEDSLYRAAVKVDSTITIEYLRQIGYEWPESDLEYVSKIITHMRDVKFI